MENNNMNNELEQLRSQMAVLKDKLDNQEIVNDSLIKDSMSSKMSWIRKYIVFEIVLIPIIALLWAPIIAFTDITWWSFIVLMIGIVIDVYCDYRINVSAMKPKDYEKNNLIETAQKLVKMKHQRFVQMLISVPLVLIWFAWVFLEVYLNSGSNDMVSSSALVGGMVGGVIGCIIGLGLAIYLYRKMQNTNDDVIRQINEIVNEG